MPVNEFPQESPPIDIDLRNVHSPAELAELETDGVPGAGHELFPERSKGLRLWLRAAGIGAIAIGVGLFRSSRKDRSGRIRHQSR